MKIQRSFGEVFSKVDLRTAAQVARLFRDVKSPLDELLVFVGVREFEENHRIKLRSGYEIQLNSLTDFRQAFWDCWVRDPYDVRPDDQVIVDAGANIGCFSIYAASKAPHSKIYCLEPSVENYECLVKNIEANALSSRITPKKFGVAAKTGTLELNTEHASPYHSAFAPGGAKTESIPVRSLKDALMETLGETGEVDLLKMDCEGGEMDCLIGAETDALKRIRRIAVEYHEWAGFSFDEMAAKLRASGFRLSERKHMAQDRTGTSLFVRT